MFERDKQNQNRLINIFIVTKPKFANDLIYNYKATTKDASVLQEPTTPTSITTCRQFLFFEAVQRQAMLRLSCGRLFIFYADCHLHSRDQRPQKAFLFNISAGYTRFMESKNTRVEYKNNAKKVADLVFCQ